MGTLPNKSVWQPDIYEVSTETPVLGFDEERGQQGPSNIASQQLSDRTNYLKDELASYNALIKSGELPFSSYADAVAALNGACQGSCRLSGFMRPAFPAPDLATLLPAGSSFAWPLTSGADAAFSQPHTPIFAATEVDCPRLCA
ncbi:hypothetical protein, partial [Serratia ficaria]|uniref:hypothetical protein n=1 Tax=Serratia ficaria TaxID=61651 RepID=UPI0037039402